MGKGRWQLSGATVGQELFWFWMACPTENDTVTLTAYEKLANSLHSWVTKCGNTMHVCKITVICYLWMPPIGYCFLKRSWCKTVEDRGLKLSNFCVLTLIFVRSLVTMLSSGQLHPLPAGHSSSLSDFPNLSHGHNGSFRQLPFKGYTFAGMQPYRFSLIATCHGLTPAHS